MCTIGNALRVGLGGVSTGAELEKKIVGSKIKLCIELKRSLLKDRGQNEN